MSESEVARVQVDGRTPKPKQEELTQVVLHLEETTEDDVEPPEGAESEDCDLPETAEDGGCIVCNEELHGDPHFHVRHKLRPQNLKLKQYFSDMMGICGGDGQRLIFDDDHSFPFCDNCTQEISQLMGIGNKIDSMHRQYDRLRDSLASRSVRTFFTRTRPDLVSQFQEDMEEEPDVTPVDDEERPWESLQKKWKRIYEVNSPGPKSKNPVPHRIFPPKEFKGRVAIVRTNSEPDSALKDPLVKHNLGLTMTRPSSSFAGQDRFEYVNENLPNLNSEPRKSQFSVPLTSYQCAECPKAFASSGLLAYHSRIHSGELPFECETCGKGFAVPHYLMIHMRSHTGERPFKCEVCGKGFAQRGGLVTHSLVHSGAKPYGCEICGKTFRQKYHLTQHLLIHSGSKPFGCDMCGKHFNVKMNLREHKRRHTGDRPYKCPYCTSIGFFRKRMLRDHVVKAHPSEELPPDLADLGETKVPPSLTKEGRKAYKGGGKRKAPKRKLEILPEVITMRPERPDSPSLPGVVSDSVPEDVLAPEDPLMAQALKAVEVDFTEGAEGGIHQLITGDLAMDTETTEG